MRITSKGQVTIPKELRDRCRLYPHTEVEFLLDGEGVRIIPARAFPGRGAGDRRSPPPPSAARIALDRRDHGTHPRLAGFAGSGRSLDEFALAAPQCAGRRVTLNLMATGLWICESRI